MKTITVPTHEQVDEKSQAIFEQLRAKLGVVPNLYATLGYSSNALDSFLAFSGNAGKGVFSAKEIEAIKLAVSQANGCAYCQAAHTTLAKMNGFSEEETLEIRSGSIADEKLNVLANLALEVARDAGRASAETKQRFFDLGYDEKALVEFVSVVISVTLTNYLFGLTHIPIDFPEVRSLEAELVEA